MPVTRAKRFSLEIPRTRPASDVPGMTPPEPVGMSRRTARSGQRGACPASGTIPSETTDSSEARVARIMAGDGVEGAAISARPLGLGNRGPRPPLTPHQVRWIFDLSGRLTW